MGWSPAYRITLQANAMLMIREKAILCKLNGIRISDKELLDAATPSIETCPACGARGCCSPHASYTRWMISIRHGVRAEYILTIKRVICASCGCTHALLPDVLIPYGSYSLRFILHVLRAYLNRNGTVAALCGRFSIAVSTLYAWIDLFNEHTNLWLSVLERISRVSLQILDFFENIDTLPFSFFRRYGFSFLQNRRTTRFCRASKPPDPAVHEPHDPEIDCAPSLCYAGKSNEGRPITWKTNRCRRSKPHISALP